MNSTGSPRPQGATSPVRLVRPHPILGAAVALGLWAVACTGPQAATQPVAPERGSGAQAAGSAPAAQLTWPGGREVSIPVLGGVPNAPPRATAVPLPAGQAPPPPPAPPALRTTPLYAQIDTTTSGNGESKYNVDPSLNCAKSSVFARGQRIIWRMEVVDTNGGQILRGDDVEKATLKLPTGEELALRYGRHGASDNPDNGPGTNWFWTTGWDIPLDYPLGTLVFTVDVTTKSGVSATFKDPLRTLPGPNDPTLKIVV